jgi:hypothetical protein
MSPIEKPSDEYGAAGSWPDPITPISGPLDLSSGINHPLWIRVSSSAETKADPGRILLKADDWEAEVPLEVNVFGFALPETHIPCSFGDRPGTVSRYHRATTAEVEKKTTERYIDALGKHRINPYAIAAVPLITKWPRIHEFRGKDAKLVNHQAQSHGGNKCLLVSDENPTANIQARAQQRFPLPAGGKFTVHLWYRTDPMRSPP